MTYVAVMYRHTWLRDGKYAGFTVSKTKFFPADKVIEAKPFMGPPMEWQYVRAHGVVADGEPVKIETKFGNEDAILQTHLPDHVIIWDHRIPDHCRAQYYDLSDGFMDSDDKGNFTVRGRNLGMGKHEVKYVEWEDGLRIMRDEHPGTKVVRIATLMGYGKLRCLYFCTRSEQELFERLVALEVMET